MSNILYFGDNLEILRERVSGNSVDLIYLDPPFNSQAQYNVLFESPDEDAAAAQAGAFRDMWAWGEEAESAYSDVMKIGGAVARFVDAMRSALGESDLMAYLAMMSVRLIELRRVLKDDGTLYLHCDANASHYLKVILDGIFGANRFTNEIIWQRSNAKSHAYNRFSSGHDALLMYRKGDKFTWNTQYKPHSEKYIKSHYSKVEPSTGRNYTLGDCLNPNPNRPNLTYEWNGHVRVWRWKKEKMQALHNQGRLVYTKTGMPRYKRYLDEMKGTPFTTVWTDIPPLNSQARERLGYPTQKPLTLLERIVSASSNEGDVVLDPFCGCGTTIEAAQRLNRAWIGIDVAIHAVKVVEGRLEKVANAGRSYGLEGIPRDFASAVRLAEKDKYQFQWWANYLFNPHALREQKRGADRGVDGELYFPNGPGRPWGRMLTSVKGGDNIGPAMVRDFRGVLDREKAELGLFISLRRPTKSMVAEAASAGLAKTVHGSIPRLQIVSIEDWFSGKKPQLPPVEHLPSAAFSSTARKEAKARDIPDPRQPELPLSFKGGKAKSDTVLHFNPRMIDYDGIDRRAAQ
ncbi:site-specific DNA-methyltransferase [Rhodospirillaceae bacterium KN72]|uniref:site-specific DNA-methyltransferase (adenine-specific) n=1 Tax=Pacificispira spongiicola TaxID=2729598 RepID=A0A7Y0DZU1_9PROT|nr:DNA methyltransferase [Pacificispira spongiicola]NMM43876.1 site-specific DNA-methyltransferase [Pacificispira spongiicola]